MALDLDTYLLKVLKNRLEHSYEETAVPERQVGSEDAAASSTGEAVCREV